MYKNQVIDPWYIPVVPTGKSEFRAPNCEVRALRYYHRYITYITEHPEFRKGTRRLLIPIKDNNARKEAQCSYHLQMDLHHYNGLLCCLTEEQRVFSKQSKLTRSVQSLLCCNSSTR